MTSTDAGPYVPGNEDPYERESLCIGTRSEILLPSDPKFRQEISRNLASAECKMLQRAFDLKRRLSNVTTYDFWQILMEGITEITGSQYAFVAKRVICTDDTAAVEMPSIGEPGSCLMGLAFYFNDHKGSTTLHRNYKYQVYGCPCQWMRHDRVLLIPDGLTSLTPNNPNAQGFPIPAEGYLAVPLFHEGKCFAHFGALWTAEGLRNRPKDLTWGLLEMFLHALEDQVAARILEGLGLGSSANKKEVLHQNMVSGAVAMKHSLRPYARRLSHELRTPMQGVVGMLDVMYASVLEATQPEKWGPVDIERLKETISSLRANIEVAQDSSKRAVDAADNMVHAYDFNMEVPITPATGKAIEGPFGFYSYVEEEDDTHRRNYKRRRSSGTSGRDSPHKIRHIEPPDSPAPVIAQPVRPTSPRKQSVGRVEFLPHYVDSKSATKPEGSDYFSANGSGQMAPGTPGLSYDAVGRTVNLNSRPLKLRELLHEAVHDSLCTGGRPDFTKITDTPTGERVIVKVTDTGKEERSRVEIEVSVDDSVPEVMIIDGSYLMKIISSVFHNAFKFTQAGKITLKTTVNSLRQIIFSIVDTGDGIPEDFLPDLFKPFTTEDESLTRHRDGLGLGLYVARGIARKMGGDLWCERTATEGDQRGSEFRIRLPITPADGPGSIPNTPNPAPGDGSLRPEPLSTPSRPRSSSPLKSSLLALPPIEQKIAFDSELAKKLPLRILVVEDNRINRALLCSMLKRLGYDDIEEARDGLEAVEMFRAALNAPPGTKRPFDLVLMDLWMPNMDGYEAAENIVRMYNERKHGNGNSLTTDDGVTVLAVSADATEEARAKAAMKGMHGFVGKPFGIADLGKAVMDYRGKTLITAE